MVNKYPYTVIRGDVAHIPVSIYDSGGSEVILASTDKLYFTVKVDPYASSPVISKKISDPTDVYDSDQHAYIITLDSNDTSGLEFQDYVYDISMEKDGEYTTIVPCSPFNLGYNVGKPGGY